MIVEDIKLNSLIKEEKIKRENRDITALLQFLEKKNFSKDTFNFLKSVFIPYGLSEFHLIPLFGSQKGERIPVDGDTFRVGRKSDNDLILSESGISGEHFVILKKESSWEIVDLESANGTYLNGKRLKPFVKTVLKDGDIIKVPLDNRFKVEIIMGEKLDLEINFSLLSETNIFNSRDGLTYYFRSGSSPLNFFGLNFPVSLCRKVIRLLTGFEYEEEDKYLPLSDVEKGIVDFLIFSLLLRFNKKLSEEKLDPLYIDMEVGNDENLISLPVRAEFSPIYRDIFYLIYKSGSFEKILGENFCDVVSLDFLIDKSPFISNLISFKAFFSPLFIATNLKEISILEEGDVILTEIEVDGDFLSGLGGKDIDAVFNPSKLKGIFELKEIDKNKFVFAFKNFTLKEMGMDKKELEEEISDVTLNLHIVIGEKEFSLKEILNLKEGDVIELNREIDEIVDLNLNGKTIGKGKLVNIDGRLGVKILEIRK